MIKPLNINVTIKNGHVSVDPKDAEIDPNHAKIPSEVTWTVIGNTEGYRVKIAWSDCGPFEYVKEVDKGKSVVGRVNTEIKGVYEYSVLFVDNDDQIVAGCDPRVWNGTNPP